MDTKTCLVALCLVPGVGGVTLRALLDRFKSVEAVLEAPEDELQSVPGVGPRIAAGIRAIDVEHTEEEIETWCMDQIGILAWDEPAYPIRLRDLHDAPPILFCRGTLNGNDARAVSIVGTRSPSPASRTLAEQLAAELARRGWTIVSGLAWGVDFAAHEGALRNGRTIAVL
jgi:DNA processing protein